MSRLGVMFGRFPRHIRRKLPFAAIASALVALGVLAPAAGAAEKDTLRVEQPLLRSCAAERLPAGTPGVASRSWEAPASGLLTAELLGDRRPDWDLAVFREGEAIGASTSFGSVEQATTWVDAGDRVAVQACRRDGPRETVPLALDLHAMPAPTPSAERFSMESVPISGPRDLERLEALGLDVTHDVSPTDATVALYSDAQRAVLAAAGYRSTTLIPDLVEADAADRRAESSAARAGVRSALPSGREAYRVYEDYTTELKDLAHQNPAIVRELDLGPTFEGRPIVGIEISEDVLREDDGKPVYLNFGTHHAREWPSGEFPMEFARDLVNAYNDSGDPNHARVMDLLDQVRIVIVPVVNADGFIASRSWGTSPLDDDANATLGPSVNNQGAYIRKNCRPTAPGDAAIPCAQRVGSGVDLNRNYGYYWGGPGSSTNTTTQSYRGTAPFSEPEAEAVHGYTSTIHPTVFITNHTFTDSGWWLRQPGFDGAFFEQSPTLGGAVTPDEAAMKALGDAMGDGGTDDPQLGATGWPSDLGWELGDITGATEDWNYFAQGTYGYTPEARGSNFHANYTDMVVTEYLGDQFHPGEGVREAFLIAGEEARNPANHGVITGTVPPGATLKLTKDFEAPTFNQPALNVDEHLETTIRGPANGTYEWHVMPSDRPQISGGPAPDPGDEQWTMTCQRAGQVDVFTTTVEIARNQSVTVDWGDACGPDPPVNAPPVADFRTSPLAPLVGQQVNFFSTSTDPDGAIATTEWDLDADGDFDDAVGLVASRSFATPGTYEIGVRVTDDDGDSDSRTREVVVSNPPPAPVVVPPVVGPIPQAVGGSEVDHCQRLRDRLKKAKSKKRKRKIRRKMRARGC
jgi:murein tripeptide amidase MpaA